MCRSCVSDYQFSNKLKYELRDKDDFLIKSILSFSDVLATDMFFKDYDSSLYVVIRADGKVVWPCLCHAY